MLPTRLRSIFAQNGGVVTTAQAKAAHVSNGRLRFLASKGDLERVVHGVYISPDGFPDKMFVK